jgi:hypothetical protein
VMASRNRYSGPVTGSLIATSFGLVFVIVNSGALPAPWPLVIRSAGALAAAALVVATFRVARVSPPPLAPGGRGFASRGYWVIVAAEVVALFGGLILLARILHHPEMGVAWVAVVVGLHFLALARLWRMPMFTVLGVVMTALGLAGFVLAGSGVSSAAVELVSGVGSGIALFAAVLTGLRRAARPTRERIA